VKHLGVNGSAACGASFLLAHNTTQDMMQCDCIHCLFNVWGQMLHQVDVIANRLREVATAPKVINVNGEG
jgi:hypothetical protein